MNTNGSLAAAAPELSPLLIHLLKGALFRDQNEGLWSDLLRLQAAAREYFAKIGLELFLDETEGYAFLRQIEQPEDDPRTLPRLVQRRALPYRISLMLVLLRKRLLELDAAGAESRLILTRAETRDMMLVFLPAGTNEAKQSDDLDADINKLVGYGFLRELRGDGMRLEVRRIIRAFIDADWLAELDRKLNEYKRYATENA
jgi:hypothetical protein